MIIGVFYPMKKKGSDQLSLFWTSAGGKDNRSATIFFEAADDGYEKRIMLKFVELQIVE